MRLKSLMFPQIRVKSSSLIFLCVEAELNFNFIVGRKFGLLLEKYLSMMSNFV